jgi:hypothetical protein
MKRGMQVVGQTVLCSIGGQCWATHGWWHVLAWLCWTFTICWAWIEGHGDGMKLQREISAKYGTP